MSDIPDYVKANFNLYKINRWKYPNAHCKHGRMVICEPCSDEIKKSSIFKKMPEWLKKWWYKLNT